MKNYIISTVVILSIAFLVLSTFAQPADTGTTRSIGRGARAGSMNTGIRSGRNSEAQIQQSAITAIEAQIAKLKTNIEAQAAFRSSVMGGPETRVTDTLTVGRPAEAGGGTVTTTMVETIPPQEEIEKMNKLQAEHKALLTAIEEQVIVLKGFQFQTEHESEMAELQAISDSATKENATATVKLVQDLIAKRTKAFQDIAEKLGIRFRRNPGQGQGTGSQGFGAGQRRGQQ